MTTNTGTRLQKRLAELGVASRREGERLITAGRVRVNGAVVTELGTRVAPSDRIAVDGRELAAAAPLTVVLNKPRGVLCARTDPEGRPTIYGLLPPDFPHLGHVGRLDYNTEGVILLTNEPGLADALLRPENVVPRTYEAKLRSRISDEDLARVAAGVPLDGRPTHRVVLERILDRNTTADWIRLTLTEGRNRHVHRIFEAVGQHVARLRRIAFAGITVKGLEFGKWRRVSPTEVARLRRIGRG
ncbi:MAG: pseudouridine synthase [Deltaproteobacteria bacterium HGW-Deltaproteobacteria-14]|nr:MAG: pseudouridine synthase [Deltaproteobacteria bacterium HGW-Deltaproteobacteria-14]